jgi:hypothetical protein
LKTVDLQRHDTHGLEHYQIFHLGSAKPFAHCTTAQHRHQFIEQLFVQIERRLDRLFGSL